jgi:hypothetical protein
MNEIVSFFRQNGTKVLGYLGIAISAVAFMDKDLVTDLLGANGYKWILLFNGIVVAIRGHTNTAAIKDEIRVEEIAKEGVKIDKAVDKILKQDEEPRL